MDENKLKPEIIVWKDVLKQTNSDFNEERNPDYYLEVMTTIGWIYKETKNTLLMVQEYDSSGARDWIAIPKCLIIKRTRL